MDRDLWRLASVVVLGTIMSILDTTIVNVALETLGRDLDASLKFFCAGLGLIETRRVGYVVYRDEFQVAACPFRDTPA